MGTLERHIHQITGLEICQGMRARSTSRTRSVLTACLALTDELSIEAWIRVDAWPAVIAQILFRGDDHGGSDPYYLAVFNSGELRWHLEDDNGSTSILVAVGMQMTLPR